MEVINHNENVENEKLKRYRNKITNPILVISVFMSLIIGFLAASYLIKREIEISYISQSELLELEKARLKNDRINNRQLFFGKPEEAIKLIEEFQKANTEANRIVLLSQNTIYGKKVNSISKEVHEYLIRKLK